MRTKKELLQICIDNFEEYFISCICVLIIDLDYYDIITNKEANFLHDIIIENRPCKNNKHGFYWPKGIKASRIKFLKKLLKKYENENN